MSLLVFQDTQRFHHLFCVVRIFVRIAELLLTSWSVKVTAEPSRRESDDTMWLNALKV